MPEEDYTDDYVAKLLAEDAKKSSSKYSDLGMNAFMPSKPPINKPKPNTRFLRNIIKETEGHNAALLAKEAADSKARLESLSGKAPRSAGDIRKRQLGLITAHLTGKPTKSRSSEGQSFKRPRRNSSSEDEAGQPAKKSQRSKHDRDARPSHTSSRRDSSRSRRHDSRDKDRRRGRKASRSRSRSPPTDSDGRSRHKHRSHRHKSHRSRSRERVRRRDEQQNDKEHKGHRRSRSPHSKVAPVERLSRKEKDDDSDPLDDIIGPRPPAQPPIRSRGRGAKSSASGIDSRFSTDYDPTTDVALDPDEENDWDQALEALRDRQKWKQQGADRLRAAGFTDEEISKWEKSGEKKEEDVKWSKKGEDREWDRGKVMEVDNGGRLNSNDIDMGDVIVRKRISDVDLTFGRLKDT